MKTEYQKSLEKWVGGLSAQQLSDYMGRLDKFNDQELDALFHEDVRRMQEKQAA